MAPTGLLELALTMAFCSSCSVSPRTASWSRLARTRTAYFCEPKISTWATPGRVEMRGRIARLAKASMSDSRTCDDFSARNITAKSAGLTLRKLGGVVQLGRQAAHRRGDRRLHVERGAVDRAVEVELQDDRGVSERRRRGHRRDAGDGRELALEDRGDRRRHGLGAGARKLGGDLDGRELDARHGRDGKLLVAEGAGDDERRHDQDGHDRAADAES